MNKTAVDVSSREPFTLIVDDSPASQEAIQVLKDHNVPFWAQKSSEVQGPYLITPVGGFHGAEKIHLYAGMHGVVMNYLDSLPEHPTGPPRALVS